MPIINVSLHEELLEQFRSSLPDVERQLRHLITERFQATDDHCHITFTPAVMVNTNEPILVEIKFRDKENRTRDKVTSWVQDLAELLADIFRQAVHLRGYAIDETTLYSAQVR